MKLFPQFLLILSALFLYSCQSLETNSMKVKPHALGKMGEVVVVSDKVVWDGIVGDSIDYYLAGPFPITPRPEPLFDLRHYTAELVTAQPFLTELRTYLIVANLSDGESAATKMLKKDLGTNKFNKAKSDPTFNSSIGKDKWASGQIVIYIFGNNHEEICASLRENFNSITHRIHDHDKEQLRQSAYAKGINKGLTDSLFQKFGIQMSVPIGFNKAVNNDTIFWIRKDIKKGSYSMVFRKIPYQNKNQVSKNYFKKVRDEYGKVFVTTGVVGAYMKSNDVDLPILEYTIDIDGKYAKEYRGIWETHRDFMGGPYTGYLIINEAKGELLFIDAWILAPGEKKRKLIRQLEYIVKSITIP